MLKRYLVALMAACLAFTGVCAKEAGNGAVTAKKLQEYKDRAAKDMERAAKEMQSQKMIEYRDKVTAFNQAADYYLQNCRGRIDPKNLPRLQECEQSLNVINDFMKWAEIYYSPHTLQKRIEVKTALHEDAMKARVDLIDLEKDVLINCFYFHEDNYAQIDFSYKKGAACDEKIKKAVMAGSVHPDIVREYDSIVEKELEIARIAKIHVLLNSLALPEDDAAYQQALSTLMNDFDYFKKVLQEVKRTPWVVYRMTGEPIRGNRVYPGLFKPFIDQNRVSEKDAKIIDALTQISYHWLRQGNIPQEPSYKEQMAAGIDNKIGEGCSVAWALLRYDVFKDVKNMEAAQVKTLPAQQKATIVDELLIRCGDRQNNTIEGTSDCIYRINQFEPLIREFKVKIRRENALPKCQ